MHHLSHRQVFIGLAVLWSFVLAAEGWLAVGGGKAAGEAEQMLARKRREAEQLAALDPAPTAAQAAGLEGKLTAAEDVMTCLQAEFADKEGAVARPAGISGAADLRAVAPPNAGDLIRDLHERARRAGVSLRPEEQFSLDAAGWDDGAPPGIAARRRQCEAVGVMVRALLAAHPAQLTSVQCARPVAPISDGTRARRPRGDNAAGAGDFFDFDPRLSVREAGVIETVPICLTFTGRTAALRSFLNQISAGGHPVAISEVAVEPASTAGLPHRVKPAETEALAPMVRPVLSRFVVTVEFCELAALPVAGNRKVSGAIAPAGAVHPPCVWPEPTLQKRGRGWSYEVFTPPAVFCDRRSRALAAIPAEEATLADQEDAPFDLQLLRVRKNPFRLQLVGFAGELKDLRGIFADTATGRTLIGRAGDRLAEHRVQLKHLGIDRPDPDGKGSIEPVATAAVTDEDTGEEVVLTTRCQSPAGAPLGLFARRKTLSLQREMKEGESAEFEGVGYCIERIELEPALAVVAYLPGDGARAPRHAFILQISPEALRGITPLTAKKHAGRDSPTTP